MNINKIDKESKDKKLKKKTEKNIGTSFKRLSPLKTALEIKSHHYIDQKILKSQMNHPTK